MAVWRWKSVVCAPAGRQERRGGLSDAFISIPFPSPTLGRQVPILPAWKQQLSSLPCRVGWLRPGTPRCAPGGRGSPGRTRRAAPRRSRRRNRFSLRAPRSRSRLGHPGALESLRPGFAPLLPPDRAGTVAGPPSGCAGGKVGRQSVRMLWSPHPSGAGSRQDRLRAGVPAGTWSRASPCLSLPVYTVFSFCPLQFPFPETESLVSASLSQRQRNPRLNERQECQLSKVTCSASGTPRTLGHHPAAKQVQTPGRLDYPAFPSGRQET